MTMLDLGKGISEYEDEKTMKFVFEEPYKYHKIFDDDFHIISGRKGTGKSTIVDYQSISSIGKNQEIIIVRPQVGDELYDTVKEIAQTGDKNYREQRLSISKLFEFIVFTTLMQHFLKEKADHYLKGELELVYGFLTTHDLIEGSVIRRSLGFLSEITEEYKKLNRLFSILGKIKGPKYNKAKESILNYLKKNDINTKFFIDDIDGFGFEYNADTKAFLEALVICCMNINIICVKSKVPFRLIITPPTELFDNATFWNRDKIMRKTIFLRWNKIDKVRNLINKRISAELNIKRRKKRHPLDIYSIDSEKSWKRVFPEKVWNRIGSKEDTLQYIIRHTFYSPRTILDICTDILSRLEESNYTLETLSVVTDREWDSTVQDACEEKSIDLTRSVLDIFSQIYQNIEECLTRFEGRPNIWTKSTFLSFILENDIPEVINIVDDQEKISGERLMSLLYRIGFLGYGFHKKTSPPGSKYHELAFSYLTWTQKRNFDLIIVSPVFYDAFNMQPLNQIVVIPNTDLKLTWDEIDYIHRYNHRTNSF